MHSSRTRTGRSLTVCLSLLLGGGCLLLGGSPSTGCLLLGGVFLGGAPYWGCLLLGGGFLGRGCLLLGGGLLGNGCLLGRGVSLADTPLPPVNRITHSCKNITLATTSLRPVITLKACSQSACSCWFRDCICYRRFVSGPGYPRTNVKP